MPDYLDDLVASVNGTPDERADAVDALPDPVEPAVPPGVASPKSSPGPAGGSQEPRPELLEVPEEIRARPQQAAPALGGGAGGFAEEGAGRAVGPVEGRMMAVMPESEEQGLAAIAAVLGSIAVLGVPAGPGTVPTKAVGSKI